MAGLHDERMHTLLDCAGYTCNAHHALSPCRALCFVILGAQLVDGIVKPKRQFHFVRVFA